MVTNVGSFQGCTRIPHYGNVVGTGDSIPSVVRTDRHYYYY